MSEKQNKKLFYFVLRSLAHGQIRKVGKEKNWRKSKWSLQVAAIFCFYLISNRLFVLLSFAFGWKAKNWNQTKTRKPILLDWCFHFSLSLSLSSFLIVSSISLCHCRARTLFVCKLNLLALGSFSFVSFCYFKIMVLFLKTNVKMSKAYWNRYVPC